MSIQKLLDLANHPSSEKAKQLYVGGFGTRLAKREKSFKEQAKAQRWTKANDDFEYYI